MTTATLFSVGFAKSVPTGALLLVTDQPMIAEGVKTEKSDAILTQNHVHDHVMIGSDALKLLIDKITTGKHLRFEEE